ncbi:hypothetical protein HGRIS_013255 [Hohenbuehelia grisea]|uniref:Uncharacterized protein n=1 Tax=Hohenbuehelia grisea TaxID=104357 RepID=A0ABR3IV06_9AGAR
MLLHSNHYGHFYDASLFEYTDLDGLKGAQNASADRATVRPSKSGQFSGWNLPCLHTVWSPCLFLSNAHLFFMDAPTHSRSLDHKRCALISVDLDAHAFA